MTILNELMETRRLTSPHAIIVAVSAYYNIRPEIMVGRRRLHRISAARMVAIYLTRKLTKYSLEEIGEHFNRDHTTVMHACKVVPRRAAVDEELATQLRYLEAELVGAAYELAIPAAGGAR